MASRFEIWLDTTCRERLNHLAETRGVTAAEAVRQLIEKAYEEKCGSSAFGQQKN